MDTDVGFHGEGWRENHQSAQTEEGYARVSGEPVYVVVGAEGATHGCDKKLGWKGELGGWRASLASLALWILFLSKEQLLREK